MQKIAIEDEELKDKFGIDILDVIEENGLITLRFFGIDEFNNQNHRDIILTTDPLDKDGSGTMVSGEFFDLQYKDFENILPKDEE